MDGYHTTSASVTPSRNDAMSRHMYAIALTDHGNPSNIQYFPPTTLLSPAGLGSTDSIAAISNAIDANGALNRQRLQYLSTTKRGISDMILSAISIYTLLSLAVTRSGGARP
eukprot:105350_1